MTVALKRQGCKANPLQDTFHWSYPGFEEGSNRFKDSSFSQLAEWSLPNPGDPSSNPAFIEETKTKYFAPYIRKCYLAPMS